MEGGKKVKENWSFINIWKIVWFSLVLFVFVYWLRLQCCVIVIITLNLVFNLKLNQKYKKEKHKILFFIHRK